MDIDDDLFILQLFKLELYFKQFDEFECSEEGSNFGE